MTIAHREPPSEDGRRPVRTPDAPPPAGTYSQAIIAGGFVFVSGQTPRLPDGTRLTESPFDVQARQALRNLEAVAQSAGSSLRHATMVTVYLRDAGNRTVFDEIYREFVGSPFPARAIVQSDLFGMEVEITAVLLAATPPTK
ncbi:RidA family protein [Amycolatopsis taiwanensis]|uniref:Enamine deaminase RidA n=1 Tax=Amycolatopsis taiwanensis TaxID=342230 RepID=A0A9W6R9I3_9PSEU|nr:Rid family hydrolase [Amycolatopsis taiwanensis]GLY69895.1 enamine deaminase RidA [Amycolatopsis taiwanensis]